MAKRLFEKFEVVCSNVKVTDSLAGEGILVDGSPLTSVSQLSDVCNELTPLLVI